MMRALILLLAGLVLASCGPYQEPGFSAYCRTHAGVGTCP